MVLTEWRCTSLLLSNSLNWQICEVASGRGEEGLLDLGAPVVVTESRCHSTSVGLEKNIPRNSDQVCSDLISDCPRNLPRETARCSSQCFPSSTNSVTRYTPSSPKESISGDTFQSGRCPSRQIVDSSNANIHSSPDRHASD